MLIQCVLWFLGLEWERELGGCEVRHKMKWRKMGENKVILPLLLLFLSLWVYTFFFVHETVSQRWNRQCLEVSEVGLSYSNPWGIQWWRQFSWKISLHASLLVFQFQPMFLFHFIPFPQQWDIIPNHPLETWHNNAFPCWHKAPHWNHFLTVFNPLQHSRPSRKFTIGLPLRWVANPQDTLLTYSPLRL